MTYAKDEIISFRNTLYHIQHASTQWHYYKKNTFIQRFSFKNFTIEKLSHFQPQRQNATIAQVSDKLEEHHITYETLY